MHAVSRDAAPASSAAAVVLLPLLLGRRSHRLTHRRRNADANRAHYRLCHGHGNLDGDHRAGGRARRAGDHHRRAISHDLELRARRNAIGDGDLHLLHLHGCDGSGHLRLRVDAVVRSARLG